MQIKLTPGERKTLLAAIDSAIRNETTLIQAYENPYKAGEYLDEELVKDVKSFIGRMEDVARKLKNTPHPKGTPQGEKGTRECEMEQGAPEMKNLNSPKRAGDAQMKFENLRKCEVTVGGVTVGGILIRKARKQSRVALPAEYTQAEGVHPVTGDAPAGMALAVVPTATITKVEEVKPAKAVLQIEVFPALQKDAVQPTVEAEPTKPAVKPEEYME